MHLQAHIFFKQILGVEHAPSNGQHEECASGKISLECCLQQDLFAPKLKNQIYSCLKMLRLIPEKGLNKPSPLQPKSLTVYTEILPVFRMMKFFLALYFSFSDLETLEVEDWEPENSCNYCHIKTKSTSVSISSIHLSCLHYLLFPFYIDRPQC